MERRWTRALVTGASSGIGLEMARLLAQEGTELVLVARSTERLEALAAELEVETEVMVADLGQAADVARVVERIVADEADIDLVVNNAGLGFFGDFVDIDRADKRQTVNVNVVALHEFCDAAARTMAKRGSGTILNVSSVAGDLPGPKTATYNATKAFVTSLSESLAMELEPLNVVVSCLCPGLTRTDFQSRADYDTSGLPERLWMTAEEVARIGLDGAAAGKVVVTSGPMNRVASRAVRSMPRATARFVTEKLNRR